jgi:hypothetical protein
MSRLSIVLLAAFLTGGEARAQSPARPQVFRAERYAPKNTPTFAVADIPQPVKHGRGITRCALCHTTESWRGARFAHDRTGFPLRGRHAEVTCQDCHYPTLGTE